MHLDWADVLVCGDVMSKRPTWIGGGNELQSEFEQKVEEQRQIDEVWAKGAERRKHQQDAVDQLAKAREQLLALSIMLYRRARIEDQCGEYDFSIFLHHVGRMCRDIRANWTVNELEAIGTKERGE